MGDGLTHSPPQDPPDAEPAHLRCSALLAQLAAVQAERLSVDEVLATLGERSNGWMMLLLALPALVLPPGVAALAGLPLLLVTSQLLFGRHRPWLPRFVRERSFAKDGRNRFFARVMPTVAWAERRLRPRQEEMFDPLPHRLLAGGAVVMSAMLILPVPFAHTFAALSIAAFGVALVERDGAAVWAGWGLMTVSLALFGVIVGGAWATILHFTAHLVS